MPDASLVQRARRGDAAAFEALVRRYYRAAYSVALARLGTAMDAEDVCQDAFIRALERIEDPDPARFAAWLLQIVRNRAHNYRAYQRIREAKPLDEVSAAGVENPSRDAERSELRTALEAALGELSEVQREVVLLHDMEGWKHREIGDALGISEGMSRQHLMMARRALRERLGVRAVEEYGDE
ncbi:MAG: sigma-70 family RNA polymerase sigma factor [Gemmatimonadetes bacterium]|uniref:Sigma-70 family RNA polymerase sigma factor n=1 Tax=Candidatus Kutchimonas denitrificans TaxID=3056748 RepID=A0AAE4Z8R1_9BACT|nr:sigma-70 family RNA polymerase sigma factor [Gemmatimonadota bacterium]NIR73526.1 sigma-70 family RNA polymerase sigma factor [Candidatus Kutchimonas denitrificans]NIR99485.1 sigma-70 family RNA polymerase sigma factor [Gemmatimonadota bacterium]NIT65105.1 sigma-70 family RNA polymerase sigma factor [Gemmatimonadota bacterium]NIV23638.1 sigma-70 family RNA polymerase sigma factor [Gemmatimonadota bacterium]